MIVDEAHSHAASAVLPALHRHVPGDSSATDLGAVPPPLAPPVSSCPRHSRQAGRCLWWRWVVHLTLRILPARLKGVGSSPALCPSQFSCEAPIRDDRRHWLSSVGLSPWVPGRVSFNCISQRTIDSFVSRSQSCGPGRVAFQQTFISPPTCFAVSLLSSLTSSQVPAPRTTFPETPLFEVSAKVHPRILALHQNFAQGDVAPSQRASPFRLEYQMHCHCRPETTEQSLVSVQSLRLRNSPDFRCARLDRLPLLGDNHCL